jgi:arabinosaccharide transport system permease protein
MTQPMPTKHRQTPRSRVGGWVIGVLLLAMATISLVPFLLILIGTFQDGNQVIRGGMTFNVDWLSLSFRNYTMLFTDSGLYFSWFANSLILTVTYVLGTLLISSFVAYGLAMYDFKGKTAAFIAVLLILTVPFEMLMLPLYTQVNKMNLDNTFIIVILPFLASAVTIFFFRQYFQGIPRDILEAGRIDGVTEYGIFFRLIVPIAKPAYAAMAILNGMTCWNNFLWPLLVLRDADKFTLPIGLNTLLTPYGNNYELLIIGSFFSLIPILILFIAFQRFFVEGMTAGAVKG